METKNVKLSNYVGQVKDEDKQSVNDHMVNVDKDLQNLRLEVNKLIRYVKGQNYEDIAIGAVSLGAGATAPGLSNISSTNIQVRVFDGNVTTEQLNGCVEIPHSYEEGTAIYPHLHWMPTTNTVANVTWQLEYAFTDSEDNTIFSAISSSTTLSVNSSATGIAWDAILAEFQSISGTGLAIGAQLAFRLFRDPTASADSYPDDAALLTLGFHFRQNSLGSSQRLEK